MTPTPLDYVSGQSIIPEGAFGISPSQLELFFSRPHEWYSTQVLGEPSPFQGSTSTYLGTVTHYVAEQFARHQRVDKAPIFEYLYNHLVLDKSVPPPSFTDEEAITDYLYEYASHPTIDCSAILDQYRIMGNEVIQYLRSTGIPTETEQLVCAEVLPGFYASGSVDAFYQGTVIDYKTTSATSVSDSIPYKYKLQLLTYAYIYRKLGKFVDRLRIVWITQPQLNRFSEKTGKALKDYPCQVVPVTYVITADDWLFIESLLKLVAETVMAHRAHPDLTHIIWRDYRLKPL